MVCGKWKLPTVILPVMELTSPDRVKQGKKGRDVGRSQERNDGVRKG